jgi:hypothetical protein
MRSAILRVVAVAGLSLATSVASAGAVTVSQTFTYTGSEQIYTVPAGVSSVQILAVGGRGGNANGPLGGAAEQVSGQLSVAPGETLYVEVGGSGEEGVEFERSPGAFNGGAAGGVRAGGGGGASDVRTTSRSAGLFPDPRLLVAGGGGGGGATGGSAGGQGGAAGEAGEQSETENQGGGAGQPEAGGKGGSGCGENGFAGLLGAGGNGGFGAGKNIPGGGGGGGGLYGGGGGAGSCGGSGGGGGGGSSLVPSGGSQTHSSEPSHVQISYTISAPGLIVVTGGATGIGRTAATLNATVRPGGRPVTNCHFQYGPTLAYGSELPCTPSPGTGDSPVAVSAFASGLSPGTVYHFRIVASNSLGTSYGGARDFRTLP